MIEPVTVQATLIFATFLIVGLVAFTFSWYTPGGSAVDQRPYGDIDHNAARERPSELGHDITSACGNGSAGVGRAPLAPRTGSSHPRREGSRCHP
jgi:hypothetical protein